MYKRCVNLALPIWHNGISKKNTRMCGNHEHLSKYMHK